MDLVTTNPQKNALTLEQFEESLHKAIDKPTTNFRMKRIGPSRQGGRREVKVHNGAHRAKWAKTIVNASLRTISINVFLNFKQNKLSTDDYIKLKNLAIAGIKQYWSNTITVNGVRFNVTVNALHKNSRDAIPVDLKIEESEKYARSMNPAILGIDAKFIYQKGQSANRIPEKQINNDFKLVAAHEFGHSVLMYVGGISLSWGHKGSVNVLFQNVKSSAPGYPTSGNLDLMKYYNKKKKKEDLFQRVNDSVAMEIDIKRLIWSSEILWAV